MNLTINPMYKSSMVFTCDKPKKKDNGESNYEGKQYITEGMSPAEILARIEAAKPKKGDEDFFNMETSFEYFSKGKFKDIPEYIKAGEKELSNMENFDRENQSNTLEYQEKLADKVLSEDSLKNNKSIRESLFEMVTRSNNVAKTDFVGVSLYPYIEEKTNARIKVMDAYAKDEDMQNTDAICETIGPLVLSVKREEQADLLIRKLEENRYNDDKKLFRVLGMMFRDDVPNEQIRHIRKVEDIPKHVGYGMNYLNELDKS